MLCFSSSLGFYRVYIHVLWSSWVKSLCETCQFEHILANPGGGLTELYKVCLTHAHATKWLAQELAEYFPRWSTVVQAFFWMCVRARFFFVEGNTNLVILYHAVVVWLWFDSSMYMSCQTVDAADYLKERMQYETTNIFSARKGLAKSWSSNFWTWPQGQRQACGPLL